MIEVRIRIPTKEYFETRDILEQCFNDHAIPIWMSADSVIRTWAGLSFYEWFEKQDQEVDWHIGWGEIQGDWQSDPVLAAVSHDFVDDDQRIYALMLFHDGELECDDTEEYRDGQRDLALMFKLAHGGMA